MMLMEFIKRLQYLADKHGNVEVVDENSEPLTEPEEVDGAVVVCRQA